MHEEKLEEMFDSFIDLDRYSLAYFYGWLEVLISKENIPADELIKTIERAIEYGRSKD